MNNLLRNIKHNFLKIFQIKKMFLFFLSSLGGVSIDLLFFYTLTFIKLDLYIINIISSSLAIATTYYISTAILFIDHKRNKKDFMYVFIWYVFSINFFSLLIVFLNENFTVEPIFCKILTLPLSFIANFTFNSLFFKKRSQGIKDA